MPTAIFQEQTIDSILRDSAWSALRELKVQETQNEVVLSGTLPSYYLKQMAQESVRPALAGRRLLNHIRVVTHD
jgi:hypothetical protein